MAKKILFIIPPYGAFDTYIPSKAGQKKHLLTPPYGVLSIIAYVDENREYDIRIFDCNKYILEHLGSSCLEENTFNELARTVVEFDPNYVFVSALFDTNYPHLKLVSLIKAVNPNVPVFLGGGLATNLYTELFEEYPEFDAMCFGEGEIPVKKFLDSDISVDELHTISPAWITKKSLADGIVPRHDMVEDIDTIPLIDFSYIDYKKYNGRSYIDKSQGSGKIELSIHTSRGCPFNCVFCANGALHGKKVRLMSFKRVVETITHYRKNFGMTILMVEDDHFLFDKNRALKILKFIRKNKINVEFPNGIAVYKVDDEIAKALADANVKLITLAIESGSDRVLRDLIDKPLTVDKINSAVASLRKYPIRIHVFVVIGVPGEFDEDRFEILNFLVHLDIDWAYFFIATPIVGSRLHKICKENNYLIGKSYGNHVVSQGNISAPGVDPTDIEEYAYYMNTIVNFIFNTNYLRGRYDIAEEYFKMVIKSYPEQAVAHFMLAQINMKKGNSKKESEHRNKYCLYRNKHLKRYMKSRHWKKLLENVLIGC